MTDDLEIRLRELLSDRGRTDASATTAIVDSIAGFPPRMANRRHLGLVAGVFVAVVGLGAILVARDGLVGGEARPPDPAAFAGDPRLDACLAGLGTVEFAFEMRQARDYRRHLPAMGRSPELEVDDPAFALIFAAGVSGIGGGGNPAPTQPGHRAVCVLVGTSPNLYTDVDIAGFQATVPEASPIATSPEPAPTGSAATVPPAPAWVADLASQLECDGPPASIGGEVDAHGAEHRAATPEAALTALLDSGGYASFPARGFDPPLVEGSWARHVYQVDRRIRAIAVSTANPEGVDSADWAVVGIRACDAAEFDPADGLTFPQILWQRADGTPERSDRIHASPGPGHCGWESTIFLRFEGVQFLRDPEGVLADSVATPFAADVPLPDDALDTGLHTSEWRLHTVPAGTAVYVVTSSGVVERWGRAKEEIGCM